MLMPVYESMPENHTKKSVIPTQDAIFYIGSFFFLWRLYVVILRNAATWEPRLLFSLTIHELRITVFLLSTFFTLYLSFPLAFRSIPLLPCYSFHLGSYLAIHSILTPTLLLFLLFFYLVYLVCLSLSPVSCTLCPPFRLDYIFGYIPCLYVFSKI